MSNIAQIFGGRTLTAEEFESALAERGLRVSEDGALESRLEEERSRHAAELSGVKARSALQLELMRCGAHNPTLAAGALSIEGMEGDDGELSREAASRVSSLRQAEPYLFKSEGADSGAFSTGAAHGGTGADPDSMSDSEYYRTLSMRRI